jgi:hypothetical protein
MHVAAVSVNNQEQSMDGISLAIDGIDVLDRFPSDLDRPSYSVLKDRTIVLLHSSGEIYR